MKTSRVCFTSNNYLGILVKQTVFVRMCPSNIQRLFDSHYNHNQEGGIIAT
jgi:hypothetical protein